MIIPPAGEVGFLRQNETATPNQPARQLATLLDHLPRDTMFIFCDPEALATQAEAYEQQVPREDPFFISWRTFQSEINRRGFTAIGLAEDPAWILTGKRTWLF